MILCRLIMILLSSFIIVNQGTCAFVYLHPKMAANRLDVLGIEI